MGDTRDIEKILDAALERRNGGADYLPRLIGGLYREWRHAVQLDTNKQRKTKETNAAPPRIRVRESECDSGAAPLSSSRTP
jgi:hypothetical protein